MSRARIDDRLFQRHAFSQSQFDEVDQDDGVTNDEPDYRGCGEERTHKSMGGKDTHQRQRDRGHDDERGLEKLEPGHRQDIDQHQNRGECDAEILKHLQGDLSLPVPLHGELIGREWPNLQRILAPLAHKDVTQATIV